MVTIIDVAKRAKVSKSTVSLVINNSPLVRQSSRLKVEEAIRELGYRPNLAARKLKGGASMTIGVVTPNIENPFFSELLLGVESVMEQAGYSCFIASSQDDSSKEKRLLERMIARGCDAFILVPSGNDGTYYNKLEQKTGQPFTLISRLPQDCTLSAVLPDNYNGAFELGKHIALLDRRVAAVDAGNGKNMTCTSRLAGLRASLSEQAMTLREEDIFQVTELTRSEGYRISGEIFCKWQQEKQPLAVFAQNDMLALGIIQGLIPRGAAIPEDIAIFGFDGLDFLRMGVLDISSIKVPASEIGLKAAELTLARLQGAGEEQKKIYVSFKYLPGQTG